MTPSLDSKQKLLLKMKSKYPDIEMCENCVGVWELPNKNDHCPVCKVYCFIRMSRTQAVSHINDCLITLRGNSP